MQASLFQEYGIKVSYISIFYLREPTVVKKLVHPYISTKCSDTDSKGECKKSCMTGRKTGILRHQY